MESGEETFAELTPVNPYTGAWLELMVIMHMHNMSAFR